MSSIAAEPTSRRFSKSAAAPSVVVRSPLIFAAKRRLAFVTLLVPIAGTLLAVALAVVNGVGALELSLMAGMYVLTMAGVEVGFHRLFSHNAFKSTRAVKIGLAVAGSMAAQGNLQYWVATHRRHHIHSDTPQDPHSPYFRLRDDGTPETLARLKGLWHAQVSNMYMDHATNCTLFARNIMKDPDLALVSSRYSSFVLLGLAIPTAVGASMGIMGAINGLLWGGFVRMFLVQHIYYANGSVSHMYGGKPFNNGDHSTNNPVFCVPTFGSAYQNNHHAFPTSALLGLRWYQPDVGMMILRVLRALGLVSELKQPTSEQISIRLRSDQPVAVGEVQ